MQGLLWEALWYYWPHVIDKIAIYVGVDTDTAYLLVY